jgi:hypothetical protein
VLEGLGQAIPDLLRHPAVIDEALARFYTGMKCCAPEADGSIPRRRLDLFMSLHPWLVPPNVERNSRVGEDVGIHPVDRDSAAG